MNSSAQNSSFRWLVLISAVLGYVTMQLANLSMAPVLPQVAESLNISLGTTSNLVMTTFLLSGAVSLLLLGGAVCDRFGALASMIMGTFCAAAPMTLMPWIGHSPAGLVAARVVEGLSSGLMFPAMGPIISMWFPNHQKGLASGLMSASVGVGSAGGVMLGPVILTHVNNWQAMCATLSFVGWAAFAYALVLAMMPKPEVREVAKPDVSPDERVFRRALFSPLTLSGVLVTFTAAWGMQCLFGLTPTFLAADKPVGLGYGALTAGKLMLGVTLFAGVIGPLACGALLDKVFKGSAIVALRIGFALLCVFVYTLTMPIVTGNTLLLASALVLAGFGVQFLFPTIYYFVARAYPAAVVGKISGVWLGTGTYGGVLGLYVAGVTIQSQNSYHTTLVLQTLIALIGFLLVFALAAAQKSGASAQSETTGRD